MPTPSKPDARLPDTLPDPNTQAARVARARLWRRRFALAAVVGFGLALTGLLTLAGLFAYYGRDLPDVHALRSRWNPPQTTRILARDGSVLAELFIERRTVVPLEHLPENLVKALLAAEDAEFYTHQGLDWPGLVRALWVNIRRGTVAQGASTITQQVVKNVLLNSERSLARKVREVLLARRIEHELGKNEILFLYVNHIAFGHGRNGVEEAARFYFGKHVGELTLGECVLLAGVPKSPVHYSPRNNLEAALRRRRWILGQMVANGFVTQSQADMAATEPVHLATTPEDDGAGAPEVIELARRALTQAAGDGSLRSGGYTIHTTIDPALQRAARESVLRGLQSLDARHGYRGPLVLPGVRRPSGSGNVVRGERAPADGRLHPGHIYTGVITAAEDPPPNTRQRGALVVRVGSATGRVPWESAARYAAGLAPSQFAPLGATVRVSPDQLITPETPGAMHLELGPQAALVAIDPATREMLAVVGASGAGKSTMLYLLGTLDLPTSGTIEYDGEDVTRYTSARLAAFRNEKLGFVFQFHHLLPEFTALENVMMPGLIRAMNRAEIEKTARGLLDDVGLSSRVTHRPGELSGGEQQRVALARALVMNPKLVLADEPTGNLDSKNSRAIQDLFFSLNATRGTTFLVVTHSTELAKRMPRVVSMRDGRVESDETR
jgi:ABC-type lipoprotein export system ATPase subunit